MAFKRMRREPGNGKKEPGPRFVRHRDSEGNDYYVRTDDMGGVYMEFISMCISAVLPLMDRASSDGDWDMIAASKTAIDSFTQPFAYALAYELDVIEHMDASDELDGSDGADAIFFTRDGSGR